MKSVDGGTHDTHITAHVPHRPCKQNVSAPYNNVGAFEMVWTPLPGPEEEDAGKDLMDVENENDLIGKPWTYR